MAFAFQEEHASVVIAKSRHGVCTSICTTRKMQFLPSRIQVITNSYVREEVPIIMATQDLLSPLAMTTEVSSSKN